MFFVFCFFNFILVAVNSTNFQSDHFPLVTVQRLIGNVAELQVFCCSAT